MCSAIPGGFGNDGSSDNGIGLGLISVDTELADDPKSVVVAIRHYRRCREGRFSRNLASGMTTSRQFVNRGKTLHEAKAKDGGPSFRAPKGVPAHAPS